MERFEQTGRSVEEALRAVEERIGRPLRTEEYRVVDVGSRGVLGLIGSKPAVLEVWLREGAPEGDEEGVERPIEVWAVSCTETLLQHMGLDGKPSVSELEGYLQIDLEMNEEDGGILIGRRGITLEAFQHMVRRLVERKAGEQVPVVVDVGGYRERRREALVQRALRVADQVKRSGRQVTLDPMPPGERRAIHLALKPDRGLSTYSVGMEPDRKVVIAPAGGRPDRQRRRHEGSRERPERFRERETQFRDREVYPLDLPESPAETMESDLQGPRERPPLIEEVIPSGNTTYGRRRLYRKPRNRPTKPANNGDL